MHRRINITLPAETLRLIDRVTKKGDRSRLIDTAVRRYFDELGRANIRKLMKERAIRRADLDVRLVEEWFPLEEEAWQHIER